MKKVVTLKRGGLTNTVPGTKPQVAFESEHAARANIEKKVQLLLRALKDIEAGGDVVQLERYPLTPRQFNLWQVEGAESPTVTKNSRLTLMRHLDLKLSAEGAMSRLKQLQLFASRKRNSNDSLAAARRNSSLQKEMRQICERELVKARLQKEAALNKLTVVEERYASLQKEFRRIADELQDEVTNLKSENSRLTKEARKIFGLKKV